MSDTPNPVHPNSLTIYVKGYDEVNPLVQECLEMRPNQFLATMAWPWETIGQDLGQSSCSAIGDSVYDATANVRRVYMRIVEEQMPRIRDRLVGMQERLVLYDQALRTFVVP